MAKRCAFCNKTDSPLSREHAIPTWISREFPGSVWEITAHGTPTKYRSRENLGIVTRRICKRCNGGWMCNLEKSVKPLLVPMFHMSEVALTPDDQITIAHWLMKTAMTYDLACATFRKPFFEQAEREALLSMEMSLEGAMHLACYDGAFMAQIKTLNAPLTVDPKAQHHLGNAQAYALTLLVKHLALQIFVLRRSKRSSIKRFTIPRQWLPATVQIWPVSGTVVWPPKFFLSDPSVFERFADRWNRFGMVV